jgi:hypothetical protein
MKKDADLIQMEVVRASLTTLYESGDVFSKDFQFLHNNHCSGTFSCDNIFMDVLPLASISDSDVRNTIKRLRQGWGTFFLPRAIWIFITSFAGHTKLST